MPSLRADRLIDVSSAIFTAAGASQEEADIVAQLLVEANLTGHDSHGVIRIPQYLDAVESGQITPGAQIEVVRDVPAAASLDGHYGFGQVVMSQAVEVALDKAAKIGIAAVTVKGANHIGRLGSYVERLAQQGIIGLLFVNAAGIPAYRMAPWGGTESRLATDPMAVGIPTAAGEPLVLDMTTTVVAEGKVRVKRNRGEPTPDGWLLDAAGQPTNDPNVLYNEPRGSILPLGGEAAGHKGYGLNIAIELLAGALSGSGCVGKEQPLSNGVLLIALNVGRFTPLEEYHKEVDDFIAFVKSSPTAEGFDEILVPGEIEVRVREERMKTGIFIEDETWQQIVEWGSKLGQEIEVG